MKNGRLGWLKRATILTFTISKMKCVSKSQPLPTMQYNLTLVSMKPDHYGDENTFIKQLNKAISFYRHIIRQQKIRLIYYKISQRVEVKFEVPMQIVLGPKFQHILGFREKTLRNRQKVHLSLNTY